MTTRVAPAPSESGRRELLLAAALCLPALIPVLSVLASVLSPEMQVWQHLSRYVLPVVTANTLKLLLGVSILAAVLGTSLAWLTSTCDFPGRRFFDWALLLPLAM